MADDTPLGAFIRHQRELSKLSVRQFASMVGISNPYLSQIERGLRDPSKEVLQSIADHLEVSADALFEHAGLNDDEPAESDTARAIREDPSLTAGQRQALLKVYGAFREVNGDPPPRRRRRAT